MSFHTLAQGRPIMHAALDQGIRCFDTADLYDHGENERILGQVLAGKRQEVFISTKVGNRWRPDGSGWDWVPRKDYILDAVPQSLKRLQTDYLDLLLLHGGTIEDPLEEVVEAFELLRERGFVRAYGISSIRPNTIRRWTALAPQSVGCMTQYSLLDRRPEEATLDHLHAAGQGVMVRGALAKGLLLDKAPQDYLSHKASEVGDLRQAFHNLVGPAYAAGAAIRYTLAHPAVRTVALGASSVDQLNANLHSFHSIEWTPALRQELAALFPAAQYTAHR